MARLVSLVIPLLVMLAACQKESPRFCETHPAMDGCPPSDGSAASGPACSISTDCKTNAMPVCDTANNGGTCVACTQAEHGACGGMTPRCNNNSCVACVDDGDCPGSVCLLNGACADAATVVHAVAMNGALTSNCGQPAPTGSGACTLEQALTNARGKTQTVIKLDDAAVYAPVSNNFRVEPDAEVILDLRAGATLTRRSTSDGAVITVNGTSNASGKLTLLGGTVSGGHSGSNNPGDGVACPMGGTVVIDQTRITANDASAINTTNCAVTITRTLIDKNNPNVPLAPAIRISGGSITMARSTIQGNRGGGLDVKDNATFTVVGSAFADNGALTGNIGGISISTTISGNRLDFNSIAENNAQAGTAAGVICGANVGFTAANNIIWNNRSNGIIGAQISGGCGHAYSDIGPTAIPGGITVSNLQNLDPVFMNAINDLHLSTTSPLTMLQADPGANLAGIALLDIDGDPRPSPAIMGADQPRAK